MTVREAPPSPGGGGAAAEAEILLRVRDLSVAYGKVEALHNANVRVGAGQIVTVIGPNGAGKTTLLAAIMGALPPNGEADGEVCFDGVDCDGVAIERMVARGMTLVPEKRELFGEMTVEDNLLLGAFQRYRAGHRDHKQTMAEVYALFPRLAQRRAQLAGTLSGGERQMLAIGRALMAKPKLLLLDEPSLGLAPLIVREIFHIIVELKRRGAAILLVEQNARAALQIADYAYVLETGEIALEGPAQQLASDPRVIDSYLGGKT
ncbi:MAG: ABC transporter ATP-binding protein [Burkholderiaceae bacterium]|nr:ABC transporter ATP-binding protein [Burkholderiaceae bacterium]